MSSGVGEEMVGNGEVGRGREVEERRGAGGDEVFAAAASATGSSRHGSIMRASGQCCTCSTLLVRTVYYGVRTHWLWMCTIYCWNYPEDN